MMPRAGLRSITRLIHWLAPARPALLLTACVLLLSGCALVPFAQAAGSLIVTLAALVGLAACGGGGGGSGGGAGDGVINWPSEISLDQLTSATGFILEGHPPSDQLGFSVAAGRDVNGDGLQDMVVGAPNFYTGGESTPGAAFVIFGAANVGTKFFSGGTPFDINELTSPDGFRAVGEFSGYEAGTSVALAKDVNGDNRADIVIGEPGFGGNRGRGWVIFGDGNLGADWELYITSVTPAPGMMNDGSEGLLLRNEQTYYSGCIAGNVYADNRIGQAVTALDINGDGFTDVTMGGPYTQSFYYGSAWMLPRAATMFGASGMGTFQDVSNPYITGFVLDGSTTTNSFHDTKYSYLGQSLAAGDVNDDGIQDLIVGVQDGLQAEGNYGGAVVVFGEPAGGEYSWPYSMNNYGYNLFRLLDSTGGATDSDSKVAFLGDVNGDGIGDFALTVPSRHQAFVVFGAPDLAYDMFTSYYGDFDGTDGFRIDFQSNYDGSGTYPERPVAILGHDVNKDGKNDILIAIDGQESNPNATSTLAYVIFGKSDIGSGGTLDLTGGLAPGDGVRLKGQLPVGSYAAFETVSAAVGDINGDGLKDLVIGVANDPFAFGKGRVYVIFSPKP